MTMMRVSISYSSPPPFTFYLKSQNVISVVLDCHSSCLVCCLFCLTEGEEEEDEDGEEEDFDEEEDDDDEVEGEEDDDDVSGEDEVKVCL